jgi:hypothetical protein
MLTLMPTDCQRRTLVFDPGVPFGLQRRPLEGCILTGLAGEALAGLPPGDEDQ